MKFTSYFILVFLCTISGCATRSPFKLRTDAVPVVRENHTEKLSRFLPIPHITHQSVEFGQYRVPKPHQHQIKTAGYNFDAGPLEINKSRKEGGLDFSLEDNGVLAARVSARTFRKVKQTTFLKLGDEGEVADTLSGTITTADGHQSRFSVIGFNNEHVINGDRLANGELTVNGQSVAIREMETPWYQNPKGFAGAEFFLNDRSVGQVTVGYKERAWIDPTLPADIRVPIAAVTATMLMAKRLTPRE